VQEILSQEEIDKLINGEFDADMSSVSSYDKIIINQDEAKYAWNDILTCIKRLDWHLKNGDFESIREQEAALHKAAFHNWRLKHGFDRQVDYANYMNQKAILKWGHPVFKVR